MVSQNINIMFLNDDPNGIIKYSQGSWAGVAYKIPRSHVDSSGNISDCNNVGLYILVGGNENEIHYAYQSISEDLTSGLVNKDWDYAVVFTSHYSFSDFQWLYAKYKLNELINYTIMKPDYHISEDSASEINDYLFTVYTLFNSIKYSS